MRPLKGEMNIEEIKICINFKKLKISFSKKIHIDLFIQIISFYYKQKTS